MSLAVLGNIMPHRSVKSSDSKRLKIPLFYPENITAGAQQVLTAVHTYTVEETKAFNQTTHQVGSTILLHADLSTSHLLWFIIITGIRRSGLITHLSDKSVVGDHHSYRSEEGFQVVGKFGSACVTGVHGDESGARHDQLYLSPLEHESRQLQHANTDT